MTQQEQTLIWQAPSRYSQDTVKLARLTVDGFDVSVKVVRDDDYDWTDGRGTFTSKWQDGAIKNPSARYDSRVYEYFIPESTIRETIHDLVKMHFTVQEARKEAIRYVKEDMAIAADPGSFGYVALGVIAKVYYKGVELAEESCWGFETDDTDDNQELDSFAWEEIHGALFQAKKKLAELKAE